MRVHSEYIVSNPESLQLLFNTYFKRLYNNFFSAKQCKLLLQLYTFPENLKLAIKNIFRHNIMSVRLS